MVIYIPKYINMYIWGFPYIGVSKMIAFCYGTTSIIQHFHKNLMTFCRFPTKLTLISQRYWLLGSTQDWGNQLICETPGCA